jgi:hypothetical protein
MITGMVTGDSGVAIQGATVEAYSLETQVTRRGNTDARGRYAILFVDGAGQYRMTARAIGHAPRIAILQRQGDEDRLVWNVRLATQAVQLAAINVTAGPQVTRQAQEGPTPGSSERGFNADQVSRLPVEGGDLALLASLVPGVLTVGATDTSNTAFSVAGLGTGANAQTLDGLLFGSSTIPSDGLRQTRVITSTYDVSRGQFSGGLVSSTTRAGSNMIQGSSQYQLQDQDLAVTQDSSNYSQGFTQHLLSGGLGGPIVKDRLWWFGSAQGRLRLDPTQSLLSADSADYTRLSVSPDSVTRFLSILQGLGVPPTSVQPQDNRSNQNLSALLRLDYVVSNSHTVTVRGDWRGTAQDPARLGATALPQTGGALKTGGGGLMATMTSRFGATMINTLQTYYQSSHNDGTSFTPAPAGRVQVASNLPDGSVGITTLTFGGNGNLPSAQRSKSFSGSNELSWIPGTGAHRLKVGGNFDIEQAHNVSAANQLGAFTYNSLADLENNLPALYRRTVTVSDRQSLNRRWGLYLGDVWFVKRPIQLTYGLRLEGSSFGNAPAYNAPLDAAFNRRTDYLPSETHLSPRVGFSWSIGGSGGFTGPQMGGGGFGGGPGGGGGGGGGFGGMSSADVARAMQTFKPPKLVIRGGIGEFRSQPPTFLVAQAQGATGLATSSAEITCTGAGIPTPAWNQYWLDPSTIPGACASVGPPAPGGSQIRPVTLFAPGFEASRAWRGSLTLERRLTQLFRLTVEGSFARGVAQTGYRDLNLNTTPQFTIASEGGRPVFVPASQITPISGAARFQASRVDSTYGQVIEANSQLRTASQQITAGVGGFFGPGIQMSFNYTWQHVRDQASGTGGRGGNTAGDPNIAEWAPSSFGRKHNFLLTLTYPISRSIEITTIGRLLSGTPFTPMVSGDVNADGARNDRAFIFAPGTGSAEALGMQQLLSQASGNVRSCIEGQLGLIAARNSCTGPWQGSLDFQLNWRPTQFGLNRRLTISIVTQNFLRGLDELVHSSGNAKGWGLQTQPDGNLLYVNGFNPGTSSYAYTVNERFGATYGSATAYRPPFQIGINMRMTIGPDRARQALDAMRGGGGPGAGGAGGGSGGAAFGGPGGPGGMTTADMIARIRGALPNPAGIVLAMQDSLHLDSGQVQLLTPMRDTLARHITAWLDSIRAAAGTGRTPDFMRLMPAVTPLFTSGRTEISSAVVAVKAILTDEQWANVPATLRDFNANRGFGPGFGPGQGRPEGQRPEGERARPRP